MTVCIAAISRLARRIVTVSDMKVSAADSSADGLMVKARFLTQDRRWGCMFSCPDTAKFESIYDRIVALLAVYAEPVDSRVVEEAVSRAYADELKRLASNALNLTTMDLETFELHGKDRLTAKRFAKISEKIQSIELGVHLLVFGFDDHGEPNLFTSDSSGITYQETALGFTAIGSGSIVARNWLLGNTQFLQSHDVGEVAFRLCEAKFTAEMSEGVGTDTVVVSLEVDGTSTELFGDMLKSARRLWKKRRTAKVPKKVLATLLRGFTFNKDGSMALPTALNDSYEARARLGVISVALTWLRVRGTMNEGDEKAVVRGEAEAQQLIERIAAKLEIWSNTGIRPNDYKHDIIRLDAFINELQRILDSYPGPDV